MAVGVKIISLDDQKTGGVIMVTIVMGIGRMAVAFSRGFLISAGARPASTDRIKGF